MIGHHRCSFYCQDGNHCSIVDTTRPFYPDELASDRWRADMRRVLMFHFGPVTPLRIEPAREAYAADDPDFRCQYLFWWSPAGRSRTPRPAPEGGD